MSRLAFWYALAALLPATASAAGSYRAGPLGAWDQNGEFSCEGGQVLVFPGGEYAVVPRADDATFALIDSRYGRSKVGGNAVGADLERLRNDPGICAGPVDCDDWDAVAGALKRCWQEPRP